MSNEMNQNKGRQTHNKTATENSEPTPKQLLRKRKHRIPLRNLVLSSMGDGDLFATLFNIDKGWGDFWWWEMSVMTGKDLFDFLTDLQKKSKTSLDKTRDATLDLIDRALRNMHPIIERTSKIQTI